MVDRLMSPLDQSYLPSFNMFNYDPPYLGPPVDGREPDIEFFTSFYFWSGVVYVLSILPFTLLSFGWKIYFSYMFVGLVD